MKNSLGYDDAAWRSNNSKKTKRKDGTSSHSNKITTFFREVYWLLSLRVLPLRHPKQLEVSFPNKQILPTFQQIYRLYSWALLGSAFSECFHWHGSHGEVTGPVHESLFDLHLMMRNRLLYVILLRMIASSNQVERPKVMDHKTTSYCTLAKSKLNICQSKSVNHQRATRSWNILKPLNRRSRTEGWRLRFLDLFPWPRGSAARISCSEWSDEWSVGAHFGCAKVSSCPMSLIKWWWMMVNYSDLNSGDGIQPAYATAFLLVAGVLFHSFFLGHLKRKISTTFYNNLIHIKKSIWKI